MDPYRLHQRLQLQACILNLSLMSTEMISFKSHLSTCMTCRMGTHCMPAMHPSYNP